MRSSTTKIKLVLRFEFFQQKLVNKFAKPVEIAFMLTLIECNFWVGANSVCFLSDVHLWGFLLKSSLRMKYRVSPVELSFHSWNNSTAPTFAIYELSQDCILLKGVLIKIYIIQTSPENNGIIIFRLESFRYKNKFYLNYSGSASHCYR